MLKLDINGIDFKSLKSSSDSQVLESTFYLILTSLIDKKARALHSQGHLCTFPSSRGQESLYVSLGQCLEHSDIYLPYYRDHGCLIQRGYKISDILKYWGGYEHGNMAGLTHDFPICVPIASQTAHAAGAAWKIKNEKDRIVACVIGDGGTSKGDFYESLNFSCIHKLPVLYVINANKWAISTPFSSQSATPLIHKFSGFGAEISEVAGLDFDAISNSINRARKSIIDNKKPFILICHTQRLDPHTVLDDFHKYADNDYIEKLRKEHDPVSTYINSQLSLNKITSECVETLYSQAKKIVDEAASELINFNPEPVSPFTHLFCHD